MTTPLCENFRHERGERRFHPWTSAHQAGFTEDSIKLHLDETNGVPTEEVIVSFHYSYKYRMSFNPPKEQRDALKRRAERRIIDNLYGPLQPYIREAIDAVTFENKEAALEALALLQEKTRAD